MLSRLALAGLAALIISGCHSYHPYCNSCGPQAGFQPNQVYQPPGTIVPYQGGPGIPSGGVSPGGGNAPSFQPPSSSANPNGGNEKPVPNYDGDGEPESEIEPNFNNTQFNMEAEDFRIAEPSAVELQQIDDSVAEDNSSTEEQLSEDEFVEPIPFQPASSSKLLGDAAPPTPSTTRPHPYLYDKESADFNGDGVEDTYEWLRGVVDFDEKHRRWRITYNPDPTDQDDKYGGTFTLSNDEDLYKFGVIPDDVVLIDGRVDIENTDRYGKPTYRVESVKRLEPERNTVK